jgi:beta-1,4-mannosyltransferase
VTFLVFTALGGWAWGRSPGSGAVSWYTSVLWTLPVVTAAPGLLGAFRTGRRLRSADASWLAVGTVTDLLIVVVPTIGRHDTFSALERAVGSFCGHLPARFTCFRVDLVVEEGCEAAASIHALAAGGLPVRVVTVPREYATTGGTRFKARANHFAHELRVAEQEARDDVWVLHMDDDTGLGADTVESLAGFVICSRLGERERHLAQGVLTYPREYAGSRLVWLADAIRPGCDISLFSGSTGRGSPRCGLHGELLLVRASVEAAIGWDFGPACLVEDAYFATVFCELYPGQSGWFPGRCYGASPVSVRDFVRQRERWVWGLLELATRSSVPWRRRAPLIKNVAIWACGPLQHPALVLVVAGLLGDLHTTPVLVAIVPLWSFNMGYCVWLYWEGLRLNALSSLPGRALWWERPCLVLFIPLFTLWEVLGVLRGVFCFVRHGDQAFTVIAKPR